MMRLIKSPWMICLIGSIGYLGTTAFLLMRQTGTIPASLEASAKPPPPPEQDPSWRFDNPEFNQWLAELKSERASLERKEQDLRELQKHLDAERQEILSVTQAVYRLQKDFEQNFEKTVVRISAQEAENLKLQTKIITGMSPEGVAAMIKEMTDDQVARILYSLRPSQSGEILDALSKGGGNDAKRAAAIAERLRLVMPPDKASG